MSYRDVFRIDHKFVIFRAADWFALEILVGQLQPDHYRVETFSDGSVRAVSFETKSAVISESRRARPRFGYLIAIGLILAGFAAMPRIVLLATLVISGITGLTVVTITFAVQWSRPLRRRSAAQTESTSTENKAVR